MNRKDIIEREVEKLDRISNQYSYEVEDVLEKIRGTRVKLWLTKDNKYRLLVLRTWEIKYKVDLEFILQTLLPVWDKFTRTRSRFAKTGALNVRPATLVGKKSEQILQDAIKKEYKNGQNIKLWMMERREEIIESHLKQLRKRDMLSSRADPSSMLTESGVLKDLPDFSNPEKYVKYYAKYIRKERDIREKVEEMFTKLPYRDNPFCEELL